MCAVVRNGYWLPHPLHASASIPGHLPKTPHPSRRVRRRESIRNRWRVTRRTDAFCMHHPSPYPFLSPVFLSSSKSLLFSLPSTPKPNQTLKTKIKVDKSAAISKAGSDWSAFNNTSSSPPPI